MEKVAGPRPWCGDYPAMGKPKIGSEQGNETIDGLESVAWDGSARACDHWSKRSFVLKNRGGGDKII